MYHGVRLLPAHTANHSRGFSTGPLPFLPPNKPISTCERCQKAWCKTETPKLLRGAILLLTIWHQSFTTPGRSKALLCAVRGPLSAACESEAGERRAHSAAWMAGVFSGLQLLDLKDVPAKDQNALLSG